MRNERVQDVSNLLRSTSIEVFDDWHSSGPESDVYWRKYEEARGHSYIQALNGDYARHVFEFDLYHLKRCDAAVLVTPCGRSGYLELGWMLGQGKPGFILLEKELDRWDVMLQFATSVVDNTDDLISVMDELKVT
jgi:nucleoside 2-deoxyribosyltransferase